jgi:hypothetical protein
MFETVPYKSFCTVDAMCQIISGEFVSAFLLKVFVIGGKLNCSKFSILLTSFHFFIAQEPFYTKYSMDPPPPQIDRTTKPPSNSISFVNTQISQQQQHYHSGFSTDLPFVLTVDPQLENGNYHFTRKNLNRTEHLKEIFTL